MQKDFWMLPPTFMGPALGKLQKEKVILIISHILYYLNAKFALPLFLSPHLSYIIGMIFDFSKYQWPNSKL